MQCGKLNDKKHYEGLCIKLYDISTEESNTKVSEVNDMLLDNDDFNYLFEYGDYNADVSVSLEVISNIPECFEEILFKSLQNKNSDVKSLQNDDSNIKCLQNEDLDIKSESSQNENSDIEEFPNKTYADLIILVTKYNLDNKVNNAIIKFFNKHFNLSISPFSKNIETDATTTDTLGKESLHPIYISLGNIPININVYVAIVSNRMHHLDLRGLQSISLLTVDNYRNLMKVMVFIVNDLLDKDFSEVYIKWNEMYLLSQLETFKKSNLENFQEAIEK
ncbi:hypothetical protein Glove_243g21 [Diversispora epigaea]|uniref:Uncharacterized protein n=1 Tax=Diversispora epigaea TaxID=1348612 RepID=A0A397IER6_9GLOM|nr:hypothetical protein Glove_243g21 [Diversispora epigaea]